MGVLTIFLNKINIFSILLKINEFLTRFESSLSKLIKTWVKSDIFNYCFKKFKLVQA